MLEVGPGMGVMTQFLVGKGRPVKVVEIDFESVAYLRANYPQLEENIIEDDFLKMHLERTFGGNRSCLRATTLITFPARYSSRCSTTKTSSLAVRA